MAYKVMGITDGKLLYVIDGTPNTIGTLDIPFGSGFTLGSEQETMTWEGDDDVDEEFYAQVISGTLTWDKWDATLLETVFDKTPVTSGIPEAEAERLYMGDDSDLAPVEVGFQIDLKAKDDSDGSEVNLRLTVFRAKLSPWTPPEVGNRAKWGGFQFQWKAIKTTVDLINEALPGVPTNGAAYAISELA